MLLLAGIRAGRSVRLYPKEHVQKILEAFDLTKSYRAATLCGRDHHTVKANVDTRIAGLTAGASTDRTKPSDPVDKIIERVAPPQCLVRGDVVHDKLNAMSCQRP